MNFGGKLIGITGILVLSQIWAAFSVADPKSEPIPGNVQSKLDAFLKCERNSPAVSSGQHRYLICGATVRLITYDISGVKQCLAQHTVLLTAREPVFVEAGRKRYGFDFQCTPSSTLPTEASLGVAVDDLGHGKWDIEIEEPISN